jgi:NADP-dependent 3-hydroxy acid dehydrogenase YdfG
MFAADGAKVMASARRADRLASLKEEAAAAGTPLETSVCDVTDVEQVAAMAAATRAAYGTIQILVFVTGTNTTDRALPRLKPAIWDDMISTNLNGAYYCVQAVLPEMREARFGHMIFVSSTSALGPDGSGAAYQASKRGLNGLSHAIRLEEKENGIRTTVVCPGMVDSELLDRRPVQPTPEQRALAMLPEHVAEAILFCAKMPPRVVVPELHMLGSAF